MKSLKTLLLALLSMLLVLLLVFFQLINTINGAVLSAGNFTRVFDRTFTPEEVGQLFLNTMADTDAFIETDSEAETPPRVQQEIDNFSKQLSDAIDTEWFNTEIPKLIKGCFAYFMSGAPLPAIDIRPLKEAMADIYTDQIIAHSGPNFRSDLCSTIAEIEALSGGITKDGEVTDEAVSAFMSITPFNGLDVKRETAVRILKRMSERKADGSDLDEVFSYTVGQLMSGLLGTESMADELDMNQLLVHMYGSEDNPVSALKGLIVGMKNSLFLLALLTLLLLLCAMAAIAHTPRSIMRWTGIPFIIAGALFIMLSFFPTLVNSLITGQVEGPGIGAVLLMQGWALSYIASISTFMLAEGIIVALIGAGLVVGAHFVKLTPKKRHASIRVIAAVLLILAIPLVVALTAQSIGRRLDAYRQVTALTQQHEISVSEALNETLGGSMFGQPGFEED